MQLAASERFLFKLAPDCSWSRRSGGSGQFVLKLRHIRERYQCVHTRPQLKSSEWVTCLKAYLHSQMVQMEKMNPKCRWRKSTKSQLRLYYIADIKEFRDSRIPMRDPSSFWKFSRLARLKVCAKIIFSVPVSSAGIESLSSQAGMLLTKQRKRMLPKVLKKLVYIQYKKKYRN